MARPADARFVVSGVGGFLALTAVIAVAVMAFAFAFGTPQAVVFDNIPFALLICATIGGSSITLMAVVVPAVARWPAALQWAAYLPTFALGGAVGTFLAAVVVDFAGVASAQSVFAQNIRGTIPTSIIIGAVITMLEHARARLRAVEGQLQAQRLERERAERLASEAQLASLMARVQPHFLFNTLNSVAALVRDNPKEAEQLIEQLSAVLRSSLDTAPLVPLERELALVRDYLGIQRSRFGARLRFDIHDDDPALAGATVPPFAVQTLVENAIKHVGGRRDTGVSIDIRAQATANGTVIEVTDDGDGFTPEQLKGGHGLDMLQGRLRAVYGPDASLEFDRRAGAMRVRLRMPRIPPPRAAES